MIDDSTIVITPTARLARAERLRLAMARKGAGQTAWVTPAVLDFSSWIRQIQDHWLLAGDDSRVPVTAPQTLVLWQEVIDREVFIGEPRVADMAASSWRRIHEYQLEPPEQWTGLILSEDSRRFRDWAGRFQALCADKGLVDEWTLATELPDLIRQGRVDLPPGIALAGFDLPMTPLQQAIVQAVQDAGIPVETSGVEPAGNGRPESSNQPGTGLEEIIEFPDAEAELQAAAGWARSRLEKNPDQTIAIVVPDLGQRLASAERIFQQVFDPPGFALTPARHEPWHVSLGPTLDRWDLVANALALLRLDPARISQPEAFSLLRSPFLAGATEEVDARAGTLARLITRKPYWISAGQIAWQAGKAGAERLEKALTAWQKVRRDHRDRALPSDWVARLQEELRALGFGHGRSLDSREYQVLDRWHGLLEEFSARDLVTEKPVSRSQAIGALGQRAGSTAFRERNPGAPVEILGVEEALGSTFDAAWIATLDHQTWPGPARRDPLIPGPVQARVPTATSDGCLERSRAELAGLLQSAREIRGSFARGGDEARLEPTRLLDTARIVESETNPGIESVGLEEIDDDTKAPAHPGGSLRGGTGLLQAQSNCPFRAFAEYRLDADDLTPRRPGLDARDRGSLIHKALEMFWEDLDGSTALKGLNKAALESRIESAAEDALEYHTGRNPLVFSPAGRELEKTCLVRSLGRWLELEKQREAFTVNGREVPITLTFGDLSLGGKIDRIDELDGGGSILIDYKTGASGKNGWAPDARPADVQLPAYAVNMDPPPAAITFARLRPDALGFDGLSEVDIGTPGVEDIDKISGRSRFREVESWQDLLTSWRHSLDQLAGDFLSGQAEVDPRDGQVCRYCHLHSLCRIHERQALPEAGDE